MLSCFFATNTIEYLSCSQKSIDVRDLVSYLMTYLSVTNLLYGQSIQNCNGFSGGHAVVF